VQDLCDLVTVSSYDKTRKKNFSHWKREGGFGSDAVSQETCRCVDMEQPRGIGYRQIEKRTHGRNAVSAQHWIAGRAWFIILYAYKALNVVIPC
jgi:hypothetical protein